MKTEPGDLVTYGYRWGWNLDSRDAILVNDRDARYSSVPTCCLVIAVMSDSEMLLEMLLLSAAGVLFRTSGYSVKHLQPRRDG